MHTASSRLSFLGLSLTSWLNNYSLFELRTACRRLRVSVLSVSVEHWCLDLDTSILFLKNYFLTHGNLSRFLNDDESFNCHRNDNLGLMPSSNCDTRGVIRVEHIILYAVYPLCPTNIIVGYRFS